MNNHKPTRTLFRSPRSESGFTLIELSVVLVIIGIIVGITVTGIDVYRNAVGVRIYSDFVQAWQSAYNAYLTRSGGVEPDDTQNPPAGYVNGALNAPLCDSNSTLPLSSAMVQQGVTLPAGRGPNLASSYVYQDKNGLPHMLVACLVSTQWSDPTGAPAQGGQIPTSPQPHTVLRISGVTPDLARQLSTMIDGHIDAGLGNLRQQQLEASGKSSDWTVDSTRDIEGGTNTALQSAEVTADLLLR